MHLEHSSATTQRDTSFQRELRSEAPLIHCLRTMEQYEQHLPTVNIETLLHQHRVACLTLLSISLLKSRFPFCHMSSEEVAALVIGARNHDNGKGEKGILERIVSPGLLTKQDRSKTHDHPDLGARNLESVGAPIATVEYVRRHHRTPIGGYPLKLDYHSLDALVQAGQISPIANIIIRGAHVLDIFDAMRSERAYRAPGPLRCTEEYIHQHLTEGCGTRFDQEVTSLVLQDLKRYRALHDQIYAGHRSIELTRTHTAHFRDVTCHTSVDPDGNSTGSYVMPILTYAATHPTAETKVFYQDISQAIDFIHQQGLAI